MILTDYFRSTNDITWDYALQCGVKHGVIRLPETNAFDVTNKAHWKELYDRFVNFGITPIVIEPMPNSLHDHIKIGDNQRDWAIDQVIKMLPIMDELNIRTICFNWMAHIGWLRTSDSIIERGKALVTGFNINEFIPTDKIITEEQLWSNYEYFIKAVIPYAEKYNIKLALHPDDPPIVKLGNVSRIMISYDNIKKAIYDIVKSDNLGVTMCQATYHMMGEDLYSVIPELKNKIQFVHFRNTKGNKFNFSETFHDNGALEMAKLMKLYCESGINVPIRVDHVPLMAGEKQELAGYTALGRLFAIGYLKGILEACDK
ncbi:mannonate dehydratase [Methanobrevibacter sp.]|uniref:mannonate dehydratase n=1 Tax=Methanobrevibacter sp. TaxID=66852 RepID=UPI003890E45F